MKRQGDTIIPDESGVDLAFVEARLRAANGELSEADAEAIEAGVVAHNMAVLDAIEEALATSGRWPPREPQAGTEEGT